MKKLAALADAFDSVANDVEDGRLEPGIGQCFQLGQPCCSVGHAVFRAGLHDTRVDFVGGVTAIRCAIDRAGSLDDETTTLVLNLVDSNDLLSERPDLVSNARILAARLRSLS